MGGVAAEGGGGEGQGQRPRRVTVAPLEAAPFMVAAVEPTAVPAPLAFRVMLLSKG